jgi:hypothetical protein
MADVILSSDDLTVLGGPSIVSVDVDFGPTGDRGSQIFVGNGNPNVVEIGQTPKIFDLYINLLASDEEYLNYYQYQNVDGTNVWVNLFDLQPLSKAYKITRTFTGGALSFTLPVAEIVPLGMTATADESNFNIQYSIHNDNPLASSITVGEPSVILGILSLPITIKASELVDSEESAPILEYDWLPLDGPKVIDLFITMV